MLKSVVAATSLMVLFASFSIAGQSGDYVGASSGLLLTRGSTLTDRNGSTAELSYDKAGFPFSISLGRQFGIGLRAEEELFYKRASVDSFSYSDITSKIGSGVWCVGAMSNLYYDWYHNVDVMAESFFSPYVMLGIGFANVNMSEGSVNSLKLWNSDSDTVFAYQIGIGSGIPIRKDIIIDVSYRYFDAQNIHIDQIKTNFSSQNVLLGVRYLFR